MIMRWNGSFYGIRAGIRRRTAVALAAAVFCLFLLAVSRGPAAAAEGLKITANKQKVTAGETFLLSWNIPGAKDVSLWQRVDDGGYERIGGVAASMSGFRVTREQIGQWHFTLMANVGGEWQQSNEVGVTVAARNEDEACRALSQKGMSNVWNLLFVIYERVDIGGFHKAFTQKEIAEIKRYAATIKYTMEGVTDKRMRVGTVDVLQFSEPVTSASYNPEGPIRSLRLGPDGDVNFNYLLDHKDITFVIIYVPLSGLPGTEGWLGLSPYSVGSGEKSCWALQINAVDLRRTMYNMDGKTYSEEISAIVHELLHGVEQYSRENGWDQFEPLHNVEENGYRFEHGNYLWYRDLTRNQLKNGHQGFRKESFYVPHRNISQDQANGWHYDSDKQWRYYRNGMPE